MSSTVQVGRGERRDERLVNTLDIHFAIAQSTSQNLREKGEGRCVRLCSGTEREEKISRAIFGFRTESGVRVRVISLMGNLCQHGFSSKMAGNPYRRQNYCRTALQHRANRDLIGSCCRTHRTTNTSLVRSSSCFPIFVQRDQFDTATTDMELHDPFRSISMSTLWPVMPAIH